MKQRPTFLSASLLILLALGWSANPSPAADSPQWGERYHRNMVSDETSLPDSFDPVQGTNIKWKVNLGSHAYGTPVVANGKVLVGANNVEPRDPRHQGDRGVLLCLDEEDGRLHWQLVCPRLGDDIYLDWRWVGMCTPPTVEGDRVYMVTNRFEVVCLDLHGQANGNDGPYLDEGRHMAVPGEASMEVTPIDADILWMFDMPSRTGMYPHDGAHCSILLHGNHLYLNTGNGVDNTHRRIRAPDAPSLIVLDKRTGRLIARDNERIGPRIFHATWSSPALGEVDGQTLIFYCGGDAVCYAFKALPPDSSPSTVQSLERVWRFDCDPDAPKENVHRFSGNRKESPSSISSMPVFHGNRVYVTVGGDIWWGKHQAWLQCIDATKTGDITRTGKLWEYPLRRHCSSTPSLTNGLAFVADCGRMLHCVDAETGHACWTHKLDGDVWGSTLVADGKVYVGTRRGDFWIFAAERKKHLLCNTRFEHSIAATPIAANGMLYVTTMENLYAIQDSVDE